MNIRQGGAKSIFARTSFAPNGIAFDVSGTLYASSANSSAIYTVSSDGLQQNTLISNLYSPTFIAFDANANLYMSNGTEVDVAKNLTISGNTNICAGTSTTFTANVLCAGTSPSYQWKKNGSNVGSNSITYTDATLNNNDVITCTLSSTLFASPITSNIITETVNPNLTPSLSISPSSTVITGSPITFTTAPTNGGNSPIYQWQLNSSNVGTSVGSISFDGSGQNLTMSSGITPGTGAYTVDCWFYLTGTNAGVIFGNDGNSNQMTVFLSDLSTIGIDDYNNSGLYFTVPTMSLHTWYHLAVVRDGSFNETVFLNGTRSSSGVNNDDRDFSTASKSIGYGNNVGYYFEGNISNLSVVVGSNVYDPNQSTITVPTGPLTNVTNTKLLLLANTSSSMLTDASSTQTITNNGATWDALNMFPVSTYSNSSLFYGNVISCTMTANNTCQTTNTATASYTLSSSPSWTGATSTNWTTASNWSNNTVPTNGSSVTIPASLANEPVLNADVTVNGITLNGSLNINGHTLTITGAVTGTGSLKGSVTSSLVVNGTVGTISFDPSNNSLNNLTITSGSATLGNALDIYGTLAPTSGILTTSGYITLKSKSIASSAIVGVVGGTVSGNVTVERYIPKGYRAYRDMAAGVYNAGSIFANWQEGGSFSNAGYGMFVTGSTAADASKTYYSTPTFNNTAGLDYSMTGAASAYSYNGTFNAITNSKTTSLNPFQGYRVLIRGDRGFNLESTPIITTSLGLRMYNATTLRATGQLVSGTVTYSTSNVTNSITGTDNSVALNGTTSGYSLVANPYVCPVLWGTPSSHASGTSIYGSSSNVNATFWFLNPTYGAMGSYDAYNALTGSVYHDGSNSSGYIQAGQAIFVQTTGSNPTVVFNEAAKATGSAKLSVFGIAAPMSKLYISLWKKDAGGNYNRADGVAAAFDASFGNTYGPQDGLKFSNTSDNLFINDKGKSLSIDGRLPAAQSDRLPLQLNNPTVTSYQLVVDATDYINAGFTPYVFDAYTNNATAISSIDTIAFTVDNAITASYKNRFSVFFKPTTLAVNSINATAEVENGKAIIKWTTIGESKVANYTIEQSVNGINFIAIGNVIAKNTSLATYGYTNKQTTSISYYRVKAVSSDGSISYSNIVRVCNNGLQLAGYGFYPNPVKGRALTLSLTNAIKGQYMVRILNSLGMTVYSENINHQASTAGYMLNINKQLACGNYKVVVVYTDSKQQVYAGNLAVE